MSSTSWYKEIRENVFGAPSEMGDLTSLKGATRTSRSQIAQGAARAAAMVVFAFGTAGAAGMTQQSVVALSRGDARAAEEFAVIAGRADGPAPEVLAAIDRWRDGLPARLKLVDALFDPGSDDLDEYVDIPLEA